MFSACMTLFLKNFYTMEPRSENVIAVDFPQNMLDVVKQHAGDNVIELKHNIDNNNNEIRMFALAHRYLTLYARAKVVVTSRIHVALPCVAFGTPVLFWGAGTGFTGSTRMSGLLDLFHTLDPKILSSESLQKGFISKFNWTNPPPNPNPDMHVKFTQNSWSLLKRIEEFQAVKEMFDLRP